MSLSLAVVNAMTEIFGLMKDDLTARASAYLPSRDGISCVGGPDMAPCWGKSRSHQISTVGVERYTDMTRSIFILTLL